MVNRVSGWEIKSVSSVRKRCQPLSPPATAVQDAGARNETPDERAASGSAPALWRFGRGAEIPPDKRISENYGCELVV